MLTHNTLYVEGLQWINGEMNHTIQIPTCLELEETLKNIQFCLFILQVNSEAQISFLWSPSKVLASVVLALQRRSIYSYLRHTAL